MNFNSELDLILERIVDIPPELLWKGWTDPKHLVKWFAPAPWKTVACTIDLRPGGLFHTVMESPQGEKFPGNGCYLEIIANRKLVWTDALVADYRPNEKPFMTGMILFEPHGAGTKYTALAYHVNAETKKKHEQMGFAEGWGKALDQLVAHLKHAL